MVKGSCLCGAVAFEVEKFSSDIYKCHCSKCRKAFGGASSASAISAEGAFAWTQGQEGIEQFSCESGYTRYFCSVCGSVLPQSIPGKASYWVPVGLLDGDPGLKLSLHIHTASKAPWEILDEHTKSLEQGFEF